jgi:hypothetical protein
MKQFKAKHGWILVYTTVLREIFYRMLSVIVAGLVNNKVHKRSINDSTTYVFRKAAGIIT